MLLLGGVFIIFPQGGGSTCLFLLCFVPVLTCWQFSQKRLTGRKTPSYLLTRKRAGEKKESRKERGGGGGGEVGQTVPIFNP